MKTLKILAIAILLLAGGVVQINLLVGRQVASYFEGAIQYLNLADRLYQLPLGVVGIAIGVVLLPDLSRRLQAGDTAGGRDALNRAGEVALAGTSAAGLSDARRTALRMQLHPHFLFNTLNAISTLILDKQNALANTMVTRLSHFLRGPEKQRGRERHRGS